MYHFPKTQKPKKNLVIFMIILKIFKLPEREKNIHRNHSSINNNRTFLI